MNIEQTLEALDWAEKWAEVHAKEAWTAVQEQRLRTRIAALRSLRDSLPALIADAAIGRAAVAALPGAYYMDPPDGGSVELIEQVQRMCADAETLRKMKEAGPRAWSYFKGPGDNQLGLTASEVVARCWNKEPEPLYALPDEVTKAGEPVAWRAIVDGTWLTAGTRQQLERALHSGEIVDAKIEPLYASAPPASPSVDCAAVAKQIARAIFALGDEPGSPCTRLQFKGGKWPNKERNQGGIGEPSLVDWVDDELQRAFGGWAMSDMKIDQAIDFSRVRAILKQHHEALDVLCQATRGKSAVPDEKQNPHREVLTYLEHWEDGYVDGWNACRDAMLAAQEKGS